MDFHSTDPLVFEIIRPMGIPVNEVPGSAAGRFITTDCCIACDACRWMAPKNFKALPSGQYIIVKQPSTPQELQAVIEAYENILHGENGPGPCIVDLEDVANLPTDLVRLESHRE